MGKPEARKGATCTVKLCRGEGSGGERFVRESFIPRGVRRKTWSYAARSVSVRGGWFTSLVLTEKHQRFVDM
eukprot:5742178-Pyramimonas_sp.AAC.1